jgi:hypothetical protein
VRSFIAKSIVVSLDLVGPLVLLIWSVCLPIHQSSMDCVSMDFLSDRTSRETRIGSNLMTLIFTNAQRTQIFDLRDMSAVRERVR